MLHFPRWKQITVWAICLIALLFALPNLLDQKTLDSMPDFLPKEKMNLGLDLRGGSYLLLEVDFETYLKEQLASTVDDVRERMRGGKAEDRIGYVGLKVQDGAVTFRVRETADIDAAEERLADLRSAMTIDQEDVRFTLRYRDQEITQMQRDVVDQSIEIVRKRVDETGTREPIIQRQGDLRIILQVPGLQDPEYLKELLGKTAKMTFHLMDPDEPFPFAEKRPKPGMKLLRGIENDGRLYMIRKRVMLSGEMLVDARGTFSEGRPVVSFRFNNQGGKKFAKITKENVGNPFAIVLDGAVISAPVIQSPILGGSGIITGQFSVQEVNDLALLLRSGALPAPIEILEERTVGPSLGQDSIQAGSSAALIGIVLVMIAMVVLYGRFGIYSDIALAINMILIIAVLSGLQATLTLPGIAGMVLTMGMAVDANVLIFERIREELSIGKTPFAAVDQGFAQAFKTIRDSNITTLIATFLLFMYGSGPVKGFAVTLSIGIICSMFSAILLTRLLVVTWLKRTKPSALNL